MTPGRYSSDALGVPVAFDVQQGTAGPFTVLSQQPGAIELQVENGPAVEYVGIWRIGSFYNTTEANDPTTTGLGSIAADDIDGWIESNAMTVAESAEVSIGGRSAKLRRVILDSLPTGNGWGRSRSADLASGPEPVDIFAGEWINSVWIVDMDDFEPIMIFAATDGADQQQWIDDIAQPIVDSMVFGDPAPTVEGGTAHLSTFGDQVGGILALAPQREPAPPGSYTTDAFGVPTTFEIPDVASSPWTVGVNNEEAIVLAHGENTFVAIKRVGSFYDADQAVDPSNRGLGSIPPDGVDEWIEANGLIVDESAEVTVGGRIAQFRQLRLPAGVGGEPCRDGIPSPCLNMISSSADQQGRHGNVLLLRRVVEDQRELQFHR